MYEYSMIPRVGRVESLSTETVSHEVIEDTLRCSPEA